MSVRVIALFAVVVAASAGLSEAESLSLNGQAAPAGVTVGAAAAVSVEVQGGPGNLTDWVALYPSGAPHSAYLSWTYLNGSTSPPAAGLSAATLSAYAPVPAGVYEWRLFSSNSYTLVATSGPLTVTASAAVLTVNGIAPQRAHRWSRAAPWRSPSPRGRGMRPTGWPWQWQGRPPRRTWTGAT